MSACSTDLTCIYLSCCRFVDNDIIKIISETCVHLNGEYLSSNVPCVKYVDHMLDSIITILMHQITNIQDLFCSGHDILFSLISSKSQEA